MRIVTCTGYFSTGSSAIGDLVSEYNNCCRPSDYELRFIYDPDGLGDLEYHLTDNHNRHNSGHALKRYKKLVDFYCGNKIAPKNEAYFHGHWKEYSYNFIRDLTEFSFEGTWLYDYLDKGVWFHYLNSLFHKVTKRNLLPKEKTLCSYPTKEQFYGLTRKYLNKLFQTVNSKGMPYLVLDQAVPPSNINKYMPYFEDIKVIVVERDPRDVFMLEKYIRKDKTIPTDVEKFCLWYEYTRRHRKFEKYDPKTTLLIQFEDLIYQYESSKEKIENFLGLSASEHYKKKTVFIPEKSINNTQIWKRLQSEKKRKREIKVIESRLAEYLYSFPEIQITKGIKIE